MVGIPNIDISSVVEPGILVQGVVIGSLTALVAFGVALLHRTEHIVNFAQGDLGAVPATLAVLLIVGPGWSYPVAAMAGFAVAVALGAGLERLVIRRFARAPRLLLTVATIGLAQVLAGAGLGLPALFDLRIPPTSYPAPFDVTFTIDPITFTGNDVVAVLVTVAAMVGLAHVLGRTSTGLALRACADSPDRAALVGVPVARLRTLTWVLATVLSSVALFLRAGIVGLPIGTALGPYLLVQALAAAVIGRMERLPTILVASIGLGIVESAVLFGGDPARVPAITFAVILVALAVQHRRAGRGWGMARSSRRSSAAPGSVARPGSSTVASAWTAVAPVRPIPAALRALPVVRRVRAVAIGTVAVVAVAVPFVLGDGDVNRATAVVVLAIVAVSLVVLTGWAGQVSLGQVGFMGLGAAVGGAATAEWGWDLGAGLLVAGLAGAAAAVVIGIPALRLPGLQLAVTTLAFSVAVATWLLDRDVHGWLPDGRVARTPFLGRIVVESEGRYYLFCLAVLGVVLAMVASLRTSRTGRVLVAARENEAAAASFGISVVRARLTAFAVSGFLAALAGGLLVHHQQVLAPTAYGPEESLQAFGTVVIGGLGSLPGAILGSTYVQAVGWTQGWWPDSLQPVVPLLGTGAGLLLVLLLVPGGLGSVLVRVRDAGLRRLAAAHDIEVVGLVSAPSATATTVRRYQGGAAPALRVSGVRAGYGPTPVLFGIDLEVEPGEVVALLGTNGAGKSTVLRVVNGLLEPSAGTVELDGTDLAGVAVHQRVAAGLVTAPGGQGVFAGLTVAEHLRLAAAVDPVLALASFPELLDRLDVRAGDLSGGQQQLLVLAMAVLAPPWVLLVDELTLGLAPALVHRVVELVRSIAAAGTAVVVVEQSVDVALAVADRAVFLEKGEVRFTGPTAELRDRTDLLRAVFLTPRSGGGRLREPASDHRRNGGVGLVVAGMRRTFGGVVAVDGVDLVVGPSEIVGIIGPNGAGKTTLFDLVSGALPADAGQVVLGGVDVTTLDAVARARVGLARTFQDARLFPALTVAETIAVALDREAEVRDPLALALRIGAAVRSEATVAGRVDELLVATGLGAHRDTFVAELSTGARHLLDLACVLAGRPSVILLDEPSSGIAQREAEAMAPVLRRLRDDTGAAVVVVEHDLDLVAAVADRLVALVGGRVVADGEPADVLADPEVVRAYLGRAPGEVLVP